MLNWICWIVAGVLAALNIAGLASVSWWVIVGIALIPLLVFLGIIVIGFAIVAVCLVSSMVADWTVKKWRQVRA